MSLKMRSYANIFYINANIVQFGLGISLYI